MREHERPAAFSADEGRGGGIEGKKLEGDRITPSKAHFLGLQTLPMPPRTLSFEEYVCDTATVSFL